MKRMIWLVVFALWTPLAIAQAPPDESVSDESVDQQITDPTLWPQPEPPPPDTPSPQPWSTVRKPRDPNTHQIVLGTDPQFAHYKVPPGYRVAGTCTQYEEIVENDPEIFGLEPMRTERPDGVVAEWYPKVCRMKEGPFIQTTPAKIDTSKLPPGYTATAVRCEPDEEEVEDGAKLFGIPPLRIPWGDQVVDWYPRVCRKKG